MDELPTNGGTVIIFEGALFGGPSSALNAEGRIAAQATYCTDCTDGVNGDTPVYTLAGLTRLTGPGASAQRTSAVELETKVVED